MIISIIIPCRNSAQFLTETLRSLVNQTWKNFEVVAIDDHSDDATNSILQSFKGSLALRIVTPPFRLKSASASRNFGYSHALGDYIKFLDSDDILSPDNLQLQWEVFQCGNCECIAVSGWARFLHETGESPVEQIETQNSLAPTEWILRSMEAGHSMMQCGMFLIPRRLLEQAGPWNPEPAPTDDFEFFIRLLLIAGQVVPTGGVLWYRSGHSGSLSQQSDSIHALNAAKRLIDAFKYLAACAEANRLKPLAARILMDWACRFYPRHPHISKVLEREAVKYGVYKYSNRGGKIARFISEIFGWKISRSIQYNLGRWKR